MWIFKDARIYTLSQVHIENRFAELREKSGRFSYRSTALLLLCRSAEAHRFRR